MNFESLLSFKDCFRWRVLKFNFLVCSRELSTEKANLELNSTSRVHVIRCKQRTFAEVFHSTHNVKTFHFKTSESQSVQTLFIRISRAENYICYFLSLFMIHSLDPPTSLVNRDEHNVSIFLWQSFVCIKSLHLAAVLLNYRNLVFAIIKCV